MSRKIMLREINDRTRNWTSKLKVVEKRHPKVSLSGTKTFQKLVLADEEDTRIQLTLYDDMIDAYNDMLHLGQTYNISNATVKPINPQFRFVDNDFELTLNPYSRIVLAGEEIRMPYNFVSIGSLDLQSSSTNKIDIVAMVIEAYDSKMVTSRLTGTSSSVRELQILDQSFKITTLSLWDEFAIQEGDQIKQIVHDRPIIVATNLKSSSYAGGSLSTTATSSFLINPDIAETHALRTWGAENYETVTEILQQYSQRSQQPSTSEEFSILPIAALYGDSEHKTSVGSVWIKARVVRIETDRQPWYTSCQLCKGSIEKWENGIRCRKCRKVDCPTELRYVLNICVLDDSGTMRATLFGQHAQTLLKKEATELFALSKQEIYFSA